MSNLVGPRARMVGLAAAVLVGLGLGCGDAQTPPAAVDAAVIPDAPPSPIGEALVALTRSHLPAANVVVMRHDAEGTFVSQTNTDAAGEAMLAIANGDMVTIYSQGDLRTWVDVRDGDVLRLDLDGGQGSGEALGTLRINLTNLPATADFVAIAAGCTDFGADASSLVPVAGAVNLPLQRRCVAADGKVHLMAYAQQTGVVVGTAFVINLEPPAAGETLDVALSDWSTEAHEFVYTEVNHGDAPYGMYNVWAVRQGVRYHAPTRSGGLAGPTTVIAPGFAEAIAYRSSFLYDVKPGSPCPRNFVLGLLSPNATALELDVGADVLPLIVSASADNADLARPTLAIAPSTALDAAAAGWLLRTRFGNGVGWGVLLRHARREVRLPALPENYGGPLPMGVDQPYAVAVAGAPFDSEATFVSLGMNLLAGPQFLQTEPGTLRGTSLFPTCF